MKDPNNPNALPPPPPLTPPNAIEKKAGSALKPKTEKKRVEKPKLPVSPAVPSVESFLISKQDAVPPPRGSFSLITFEQLDLEFPVVPLLVPLTTIESAAVCSAETSVTTMFIAPDSQKDTPESSTTHLDVRAVQSIVGNVDVELSAASDSSSHASGAAQPSSAEAVFVPQQKKRRVVVPVLVSDSAPP